MKTVYKKDRVLLVCFPVKCLSPVVECYLKSQLLFAFSSFSMWHFIGWGTGCLLGLPFSSSIPCPAFCQQTPIKAVSALSRSVPLHDMVSLCQCLCSEIFVLHFCLFSTVHFDSLVKPTNRPISELGPSDIIVVIAIPAISIQTSLYLSECSSFLAFHLYVSLRLFFSS